MKIPFSNAVIMSVLTFVLAVGGYGGFSVVKNNPQYGTLFGSKLHTVVEVVDGDTLVLENDVRVRLIGIDSPEVGDCHAEESQKALAKLVLGQQLRLEKDQTGADKYGRLLRYVFIHMDNPEEDDIFVNDLMVRSGAAKENYIKPDKKYLTRLQTAQKKAQSDTLGLWSACDGALEVEESEKESRREDASQTYDKECVIKGNLSKTYDKDYFLPGCPNYKRVKVDARKGEQWFCTEKEAKKAGWSISAGCKNIHQFGGKSGGRF